MIRNLLEFLLELLDSALHAACGDCEDDPMEFDDEDMAARW